MTDVESRGFGRPDEPADPATQWRPAPPPADPYPSEPPYYPLPSDAAGWHATEQLWSPYDGRPRKERGPGLVIAAAVAVAALVGAAAGVGGAWLAFEQRERVSVRDPGASLGTGTTTPRDQTPGSVADIARRVVPAVVSIDVATGGGEGTGSGVIIRNDGYIVTNNHVVASADDLEVTLADGTTTEATIVGRDPDTDLAVIKARATGLPVAELGRSNNLQVGDPVVAIGSPLGLAGTVTSGIISALNRSLDLPAAPGSGGGVLVNAIQTDAAINPGNSGGALVDRAGRVIGINSAIASLGGALGGSAGSIGLGFAIPIDEARAVAEQIIRTGRATHPFLGISGNDITPQTAQQFGLTTREGALVVEVTPGGPADRAGLRPRDIIVRLADDDVTSMGDLIGAIRSHRIGEAVEVTYIRNGKQATLRVTLAEKPAG
ncbi:MAG TPA: trypsin-like peptidase domain-containing protein [Frankiaceae bacterium]|nr:trypsin-like peptidase domain-containing protein [Frankiaceae bacterium]